jgi:hypothetical protein
MFTEDFQPRYRAAEGCRISRGFTFLMEHGQVEDSWEDGNFDNLPGNASAGLYLGEECRASTPWKRVRNPRYEPQ